MGDQLDLDFESLIAGGADHADDSITYSSERMKNEDLRKALRSRRPPSEWGSHGTSTYDPQSEAAKIGAAGERMVVEFLQGVVWAAKVPLIVCRWDDIDVGLMGPIGAFNSENGDVYVIPEDGRPGFSIEVKTSIKYPNASIDWTELERSRARYLVALTTVGMWACTMDEVRAKVEERESYDGSILIVPYDSVQRVSLAEMLFSAL